MQIEFDILKNDVAVCNIHGVPPLQWLEQLGRETERPPCRDPALHFHAPCLIALRGGDRNEETPATRNEREMLIYAPCLRTYNQPAQHFSAGAQLAANTQPTLRTGLMAPAWRLLHVPRGEILDLT